MCTTTDSRLYQKRELLVTPGLAKNMLLDKTFISCCREEIFPKVGMISCVNAGPTATAVTAKESLVMVVGMGKH